VATFLGRMSPREKAAMLSGAGWMGAAQRAAGNSRIKMADGPLAAQLAAPRRSQRSRHGAGSRHRIPAGIGMGASWDGNWSGGAAR